MNKFLTSSDRVSTEEAFLIVINLLFLIVTNLTCSHSIATEEAVGAGPRAVLLYEGQHSDPYKAASYCY